MYANDLVRRSTAPRERRSIPRNAANRPLAACKRHRRCVEGRTRLSAANTIWAAFWPMRYQDQSLGTQWPTDAALRTGKCQQSPPGVRVKSGGWNGAISALEVVRSSGWWETTPNPRSKSAQREDRRARCVSRRQAPRHLMRSASRSADTFSASAQADVAALNRLTAPPS